jgi:hypothetical protein
LRTTNAECRGRVNLYQEALQPIQDGLDGLRHKIQEISESLAKFPESSNSQLQAVEEMRQILNV